MKVVLTKPKKRVKLIKAWAIIRRDGTIVDFAIYQTQEYTTWLGSDLRWALGSDLRWAQVEIRELPKKPFR